MEYQIFAKYYDQFYQNKDYKKEVSFLLSILNNNIQVLDLGAGTGIHAQLLQDQGYSVDIVDLNPEMLEVAKNRVKGDSYNQNMLDLSINKKYNAIISMFAVINHLQNVDELKKVLQNCKRILNEDGIIILDLHNPQKSGSKDDAINNIRRKMIWDYDPEARIEKSKIIFEIDRETFEDEHIFRIFSINEIREAAFNTGFSLANVYENYSFKTGTEKSKNLQFVLKC